MCRLSLSVFTEISKAYGHSTTSFGQQEDKEEDSRGHDSATAMRVEKLLQHGPRAQRLVFHRIRDRAVVCSAWPRGFSKRALHTRHSNPIELRLPLPRHARRIAGRRQLVGSWMEEDLCPEALGLLLVFRLCRLSVTVSCPLHIFSPSSPLSSWSEHADGQGKKYRHWRSGKELKQGGPRIRGMGQETCAGGDGRKEIVPLNQPTRQATAQPHPFHTLLAFVRLCTLRCSSHDEIEEQEGKWHKGESSEQGARACLASARHGEKTHSTADEVRGEGREGTTEGRDAARLQEHLGPG
jgi:hypothetical protein